MNNDGLIGNALSDTLSLQGENAVNERGKE